MRIASTQYTANTKSFEIYLSGCYGSCFNCHNPELKDFNIGEELDEDYIEEILDKINTFNNLIDNIWILGGEPLDQNQIELLSLLYTLNSCTDKKIWLFTRYELDEIPNEVKNLCDYIKTGCYEESLKVDDYVMYGVKIATSNQKIYSKEEFTV